MNFISEIRDNLRGKNLSIVYPEGEDSRILKAAYRLKEENILEPILLGDYQSIKKTAEDLDINIDDLIVINPKDYYDLETLAQVFVERRSGKIDLDQARDLMLQPNYFGTLLVESDRVDGMVSGAVYTTAETVRPALQIIKTVPGINRTSGLFLLFKGEEKYLMSDCAINTVLDAKTLSEIAIMTDKTGRQFGFDPKIAMLSFSTMGSASSEEVDVVRQATKLAKEKAPSLVIDGEMQFDAAFSPRVAKQKAPDSLVAGKANAFIFPNLSAANIGYKIAQRMGEYEAVGPILQGLNKPVNDLSRGCNEDDVYALSILTAAQSLM